MIALLHRSVPMAARQLLTLLVAVPVLALAGCGGSSTTVTPVTPVAPVTPAFDSSKGEGNVLASQLVVSYPTASSGTQVGLDSFYQQVICPSQLSTAQCAMNEASLNATQFGNFNVSSNPIAKNALGIAQVDAYKLNYTALNVDGSAVPVSGGVLLPKVASTSLKGVILFFHSTTVQRTNVPSNFTATSSPTSFTEGTLMAAVWASQGYAVVMPDYIGLGDDTTHPHPYVVYPAENAQTGLAMLKAAGTLLGQTYGSSTAFPLFITGYSEGGAYSLEAAQLMQNNANYASVLNVQLRMAAPMSGFFDLSGTGLSYLFSNISDTNNPWYSLSPASSALGKPYLTAYLLLSFADYGNVPAAQVLSSPFLTCASGSGCETLNDLYFTDPQSSGYDDQVALFVANQATNTAWTQEANSIQPLLTPAYAAGLMQKDTSNALYARVAAADTYTFTPQVPVTLVSLKQDSTVTRVNSDVAYQYFTAKNPSGSYQEQLVDNANFVAPAFFASPGPIDHSTELPFLSVLVLNQFNTAK